MHCCCSDHLCSCDRNFDMCQTRYDHIIWKQHFMLKHINLLGTWWLQMKLLDTRSIVLRYIVLVFDLVYKIQGNNTPNRSKIALNLTWDSVTAENACLINNGSYGFAHAGPYYDKEIRCPVHWDQSGHCRTGSEGHTEMMINTVVMKQQDKRPVLRDSCFSHDCYQSSLTPKSMYFLKA